MLQFVRGRVVGAVACVVALVLPAAAFGQQGVTGYDGSNPFGCTLQQVGTGTDFPQPDADPFCVEFEKRNQNVTQLGIVDFIAQEPARVAAALDKCFYFQHDHWRASVVQDNAATVLYEWDGSYFFDKARGRGGVYLENFKIAGQTSDPSLLPGFPEEWKPYFGPGRGGVQATGEVEADPRCGNAAPPENPPPATPSPAAGEKPPCLVPGGTIGRGIGGLRLGQTRAAAKADSGAPSTEATRYASWCLDGGGSLLAAFDGSGDRSRVRLLLTDSPPFDAGGIAAGIPAKTARRKLRGEKSAGRARGAKLLTTRWKGRTLFVGLARSRVTYVGVAKRGTNVARVLRAAPR